MKIFFQAVVTHKRLLITDKETRRANQCAKNNLEEPYFADPDNPTKEEAAAWFDAMRDGQDEEIAMNGTYTIIEPGQQIVLPIPKN